jgi:hypothetical protein
MLDSVLLWSVFGMQFALAVLMARRWYSLPIFTAYLWLSLLTYLPWLRGGAGWAVWIVPLWVLVSVESLYLLTINVISR